MTSLVVRDATEADAALLHGWRDDPLTRHWSRNTAEVPFADHLNWLRGVLASDQRLLLVAESPEGPLGSVRFDQVTDGVWEVSITVAPERRGRGLAAEILAAGEHALVARRPAKTVLASVHRDNAASARLFERAGYTERAGTPEDGRFRELEKPLAGS